MKHCDSNLACTWHDGMSDALKVVRSMSRTFRDLRPPGVQAILDDLETTFAAALERGHLSRSHVFSEVHPGISVHPVGCFSSSPTELRDCYGDGHYACKRCTRREET